MAGRADLANKANKEPEAAQSGGFFSFFGGAAAEEPAKAEVVEPTDAEMEAAAAKIQSVQRGKQDRKKVAFMIEEREAAATNSEMIAKRDAMAKEVSSAK